MLFKKNKAIYEIILCQGEPLEEKIITWLSPKEVRMIQNDLNGLSKREQIIKLPGGRRIETGIIDIVTKIQGGNYERYGMPLLRRKLGI